jgi:predicted extracellular nuclease
MHTYVSWSPALRALPLALALFAGHVGAQTADTPIYNIQGSSATSPLVDQTVTTSGIVTKVHTNGFFLQDAVGDGNPATSDGIFVFTSTVPTVAVGQWVRLSGKITEFNTGSATNLNTKAHTVTELTTITGLTLLGSGYSIAPTAIALPEVVNDDLERFEGMLVTLAGPLTVNQNYFQAQYGQLTLAAGGRMETPTNRYRPGPAAVALSDENARRRIVLDDGSTRTRVNPTPYIGSNGLPRAGDTVGDITGVIDYGLATASNAGAGVYKIHPHHSARHHQHQPAHNCTPSRGRQCAFGCIQCAELLHHVYQRHDRQWPDRARLHLGCQHGSQQLPGC